MHENARGRAILSEALVEHFADVSDGNYDDRRARKLRVTAADAGHQAMCRVLPDSSRARPAARGITR
jgi:hypothetical protein